ncbi:NmrA family NAD(P)-binding protein [Pseudomonas chlororaphis]|uniref:NmrA family NAD(P)-binding protein n=1 Tax=Pseudomonas chlororaphis TaxID=587753 RepID=UPI000F56C46A|nr:NmrA family NAD(P)-binding protein [Pseudomonas chlororaphis]AZC95833.1 hypothetical protein C4K28_3105 [Pseudomonas chlororaphis subsp. piscium]
MSDKTIVVFGATGRQGQGVVNALLDQGGYVVRAMGVIWDAEMALVLDANQGGVETAGVHKRLHTSDLTYG